MTSYGIIGFGEVGSIFARDLHKAGATAITAYDTDETARARAAATGYVKSCANAAEAAQADIVFVSVTAASVPAAVRSLEGGLKHAPFVVDVNSVSPAVKQQNAEVVAKAGGRYVEAAVMTSVPPKGLQSPMLLGGPNAEAFVAQVAPLGMSLKIYSTEIGKASSVKMCRSVMIKGLEALVTECMLSARHYGVEDDVLASLSDTLPHEDWRNLARYVISRALVHGKRRAEEMREVARTVREAGVEPLLASATAERQDWAWKQGKAMGKEALGATELIVLLDSLTEAMHPKGQAAE